ncbi:MAG TPA: hypothetical protein VMH39_09945 [Gemmatimonadaceae bacterium]|nr:hypothetical protein [Gemmatimonadaceae bacterium]
MHRKSGGERVFPDALGRLWNATHTGEAIVFTCISDGRQSGRALATDVASLSDDIGDETLRAWLNAAPRIGTLS